MFNKEAPPPPPPPLMAVGTTFILLLALLLLLLLLLLLPFGVEVAEGGGMLPFDAGVHCVVGVAVGPIGTW